MKTVEHPGGVADDRPRVGDWIQTRRGVVFYPFDVRPEDIVIEDIAHALSHCCRFAGHVSRFYSVAEHSVRVARLIRSWGEPPAACMAGLLHDAAEAYIGDMPRPLKLMPQFEAYRDLDDALSAAVASRFGVEYPWHPAVHRADDILLGTEARDLMSPVLKDWNRRFVPLPHPITPWSPESARFQFLDMFRQLLMERPR